MALATGTKLSWMAVLGEAKVCLDAAAPSSFPFIGPVLPCAEQRTRTISHLVSSELVCGTGGGR